MSLEYRKVLMMGITGICATLFNACGGTGNEAILDESLVPPPSESPAWVSGPCVPSPLSNFVANVKDAVYGAKGDGRTDDTAAIQKAINAVANGGGTVSIPAGTYLINPVAKYNAGLHLGSNMTLRFDSAAILKALPTSTSNYAVLLADGVQNLNIIGGTILGNRYNNTITDTREGGIGVKIVNSRRVVVQSVTANQCWEDGFYVGEASQSVTLCSVVADDNRRHGLGITSVDGLVVKGCTFKNTSGLVENGRLVCGAGANIEPNLGETAANVQFTGCTFSANAKEGLVIGPALVNRGKAFVTNVLIDGNTASGNGLKGGAAGITVTNTGGHRITNNTVTGNVGDGIYLRFGANGNTVSGNKVSGTLAAPEPGDDGNGIMVYLCSGNTVTGNTVIDNAGCGIRNASATGAQAISGNSLDENRSDTCF